MSASFVTDLDAVDPTTIEQSGALYPVAQWLHGDPKLAAVGGIVHTGGIILPTKYVDESIAPPPGWSRTTVAFSSGKSEDVLACQKPKLAVIRTRFRWFVIFNGVASYYPRSAYIENSGMRGHIQALCSVPGFDFPISVAFKGKASQAFEKILKEFADKTSTAAAKMVKGNKPARFPRFAWYMKLSAAPHVKVGQKGQESIITPPTLDLPTVLTDEYMGKIYVGRDKLIEYQGYYHGAAEWVAAWDRSGAEVQAEQPEHAAEPDTWPPSEEEFNAPGAAGKVQTGNGSALWRKYYVTLAEAKRAGVTNIPTLDDAAEDADITKAGMALRAKITEANAKLAQVEGF